MTRTKSASGIARITAIIIFTALVVVGIALVGVNYWVSTPGFCNICHIMKTRYVSWKRSPHWNRAGCIQCHSEPGTIGEIRAHFQGFRYVYSLATGTRARTVLRAEVSNASCQRCHEIEDLGAIITAAHDPNHGAHVDRDITCAACHDNPVHGTLLGEPIRPYMASCTECHDETDPVLERCPACHSQAELEATREAAL